MKSQRKQVTPQKRVVKPELLFYLVTGQHDSEGAHEEKLRSRLNATTSQRMARSTVERYGDLAVEYHTWTTLEMNEMCNEAVCSELLAKIAQSPPSRSPPPAPGSLVALVETLASRAKPSRMLSPDDDFTTPKCKRRRVRPSPRVTPPIPVATSNSFDVLCDDAAPETAAVDVPASVAAPAKQRKKRRKLRVQSNTRKLAAPIALSTRPLPQPPQPSPRPARPTPRQHDRVVQCFRCQGFGHYAIHCPNATRCVKCAGAHDAQQCPRPREQLATCSNCSGPHPASYRGFTSWRFVTRADRFRRARAPPLPRQIVEPPTMESLCEQLACIASSPVMKAVIKLLALLVTADPAQHSAMLLAAVTATL